MHLTPSDPDVATIYRKIRQNRLDLQPNFQRGEVWGRSKKQRLIDSILRGWHIPPVHVIQVPGSDKQEVLDGQQRLAAIRDFLEGGFPINGGQEPIDQYIASLDGHTWDELPSAVTAKIEDFTIRVLTISDYAPGEPGELFYRLNQPTNLTSAEQRNAYFGEARQQVKKLSDLMINLGFNREMLGFSNSRMAYDDVIAKFLLTIELKTLKKKVTANSITARYRDTVGFEDELINDVDEVLNLLYLCLSNCESHLKLNKATVHSWMLFIYKYKSLYSSKEELINYFNYYELIRLSVPLPPHLAPRGITRDLIGKILNTYHDRSSSRVADTSSVILRDISLWIFFVLITDEQIDNYSDFSELNKIIHYYSSLETKELDETFLLEISSQLSWGEAL